MKKAYPVVLTPAEEGGYIVYVPDFDIHTQGDDMADAMFMARDAISMMGCYREDEHQELPEPSLIDSIKVESGEIKTLVDVDFDSYRKKNDNRAVRKNVTIPSWLNAEAEKAGINFSAALQNALKEQLGLIKL
jgi:predicted RNase H-like HicB family nuclease